MRFTATSITVFSLLLAACTPEPKLDLKKELAKMEGPKPETMDDSLKGQAEQAVVAKNYVSAAQTYKQLADKEPDNKEYTLNLADNLRRAGNNQEALKVLDKYLTANPADAAALETKGLCLMNIGNIVEAGRSFEDVMKVEPTRWRTLNAVGILFTLKNKPHEAIDYFDEALNYSAENVSVLNNKALTLAMDGKYDESIETFQRIKSHLRTGTPDVRQVDMNMALVYAISGKLDDAEQTAAPYLSKAALYNNMGVYANLANNKEMSRSYLNMALTQSPSYYERAWKNLSTIAAQESGGQQERKLPQITQITQDAAPAESVMEKLPPRKLEEGEGAPVQKQRSGIKPATLAPTKGGEIPMQAIPAAGNERELDQIPAPTTRIEPPKSSGLMLKPPVAEVAPSE